MREHSWRTHLFALLVTAVFFAGCDYARMNDDEGVRLYEQQLPDMPPKIIPVGEGDAAIRFTDPVKLKNPLKATGSVIERGKELYEYFCSQCHGHRGDGNGIVGQHFDPLPSDLRKASIQSHPDSEIFYIISYGKGSQPPLAYTIAQEDRWKIIHYMRTLKNSRGGSN
ncbi:MAG: c-type cytochrome [Deltaproteobacteria bacterium]|nr:c-type cytochrome [Deltaproteobacteria bacterium]